jgi:cbb3-type cytochrome oxidase maturation protein
MTSVLYLIAISLVMGGIGLAVFLWSLKSGQYEDMEGAASRILFDDAPAPVRPAKPDKPSAT